jgi:superkiller protein 3
MKVRDLAALLLLSASAYAQTTVAGGGNKAVASTLSPLTHEQLLVSARKVALIGSVGYVAATGLALNPSGEKAQQLLDDQIRKWGRFSVIEDPNKADLVLVLFEGNRSTGHGGTIRTARLVVLPGGGPPKRGDIPLFDESDNGGVLLPTSAAPKVVARFRSYLESLDKTTPPVPLPAIAPPSGTSLATNTQPPSSAPAPAAATTPALHERPHTYTNPLEIIANAKTYTLRGSGADGAKFAIDKQLGRFGGRSGDVQDALHDVYAQMSDWGRMQYVEEALNADIVLVVYQWDVRAETRYPAVRSALNVAQGGEAYQREDTPLWTSGTQEGETKGLVGMLRLDVEQFTAPVPLVAEAGNSQFERGSKLVDSAGKKKYQGEKENISNEAIHTLRESMRTAYAFPPAHERLGTALRLSRFYPDAVYEYKRALQLQPGMRDALDGLVYALAGIPDYDEAINTARELIRVAPDSADSYLALGQVQYWKSDYPAAAASFRNAIQRDSSRFLLHQKLGRTLYRDKHFAEAEAAFREALRINPDDIESMTWLGSTLNEEHKPADALSVLRQGEAMDKKNSEIHYELARALRALKQFDDAISEMNAALHESPNSFTYHIELARTLESAGRHDEALAKFRDVVSHAPDSSKAHADLGAQLFSMAKNDEAGGELQRAIDLDAKCARAWFFLGRLRTSKGDQPGAKAAYDTARTLEPDNEEFRIAEP